MSEEKVILVRFQGLNCLDELFKVRGVLISGVSLERCPHFRCVFREGFHCSIATNHIILSLPLILQGTSGEGGNLGDTLREKLRMMDSVPSDEETEQQRDSQFMGAASIISTDGG